MFDYVAEEYAQRRALGGVVSDAEVTGVAEEAIREKMMGRRNVIRELSQGVCTLALTLFATSIAIVKAHALCDPAAFER